MSKYGRERESQRSSRAAQAEALELLNQAILALGRADDLVGQRALVGELRELTEKVRGAQHAEIKAKEEDP